MADSSDLGCGVVLAALILSITMCSNKDKDIAAQRAAQACPPVVEHPKVAPPATDGDRQERK